MLNLIRSFDAARIKGWPYDHTSRLNRVAAIIEEKGFQVGWGPARVRGVNFTLSRNSITHDIAVRPFGGHEMSDLLDWKYRLKCIVLGRPDMGTITQVFSEKAKDTVIFPLETPREAKQLAKFLVKEWKFLAS